MLLTHAEDGLKWLCSPLIRDQANQDRLWAGLDDGRISLPRFVALVAGTPAQLCGLALQKGTLLPGADADMVLFDPDAVWTRNQESQYMGADYTANREIEVQGKIVQIYSRGELIVDGEVCLAEKGRGRYLHRCLDPAARACQ